MRNFMSLRGQLRTHGMDAIPPGGLGTTYGGHPLACAAGLAVLEVIERENLCARAVILGQRLRERLERLQNLNSMSFIADIRSLGAMVAVELCHNRLSAHPARELAQKTVEQAMQLGLILLTCGANGNVLRFLIPLTIEDAVFDEGLSILDSSFERVAEIKS